MATVSAGSLIEGHDIIAMESFCQMVHERGEAV
jgi:hypothetical protein